MAATPALAGIKVLVTRPAKQADGLITLLQAEGAAVFAQPAIAISAITPKPTAITTEHDFDSFIFISQNAVEFALPLLPATEHWPAVAAIGNATAQALRAIGITQIICPESGFQSEDLLALDEFSSDHITQKKVLIMRGGEGRETLKTELLARQAQVHYLDVYQRQAANKILSDEKIETVDCLTVSSQQGLENLIALYNDAVLQNLHHKLLIVPSQRCADRAAELGFGRIKTAINATDNAMLSCIIENKHSIAN